MSGILLKRYGGCIVSLEEHDGHPRYTYCFTTIDGRKRPGLVVQVLVDYIVIVGNTSSLDLRASRHIDLIRKSDLRLILVLLVLPAYGTWQWQILTHSF